MFSKSFNLLISNNKTMERLRKWNLFNGFIKIRFWMLFPGEVALLVGNGQVSDEVEIFSPSGKCQHVLPSLPLAVLPNPIVVFVEGRILLCADTVYSYTKSDSTCWSFTPGESKWEEFRTNLTPEPFKR